jgi:hypothetical protein
MMLRMSQEMRFHDKALKYNTAGLTTNDNKVSLL